MAKKQKVSCVGTTVTVEYPSIGKKVVCDYSKLPKEMVAELTAHGLKQKLGDAASGQEASEKYEMSQRIIEGLRAGQWELTANPDTTAIVAEAISRIKEVPVSKVMQAFEKDPEMPKKLRTSLQVKAMIAKIYAERAAERAEEADDLEINL